jgi:DNA-binding MarR family transcriptional regulator
MPEETAFSADDLVALARELRVVWHALVRGMDHGERLEGFQRQQFWVLGALSEGPRRMSSLAECSQTSQASLTGIVDRLEERGLVERVRSETDRRVVDVRLTDLGRAEMAAAHGRILDRLDAVLAPLDTAERREFLRLFTKIAESARHDAC